MELNDKVAVITGGSGGIGQAMARSFLAQGARAVVIADLDAANVQASAAEIGCDGMTCDVTSEADVRRLVDFTLDKYGQIDLYCSNAGASGSRGLTDAADDVWQDQWELHVMAHIYAARAPAGATSTGGRLTSRRPARRSGSGFHPIRVLPESH